MKLQDLIINNYEILLLVAGLLLTFLGIMPIISRNYYENNLRSDWSRNLWLFSEKDRYIYNRYVRPLYPLLAGITMIGVAIYKFLYP